MSHWILIEAEHPQRAGHAVIGPFPDAAAAEAHLRDSPQVAGMREDDARAAGTGDDADRAAAVERWDAAGEEWDLYRPALDAAPRPQRRPGEAQAAAAALFADPLFAAGVGPHLTCDEADTVASWLRSYRGAEAAQAWLSGHAHGDVEPGDRHRPPGAAARPTGIGRPVGISTGTAQLVVADGLPEVLACDWVAAHAARVDPDDGDHWEAGTNGPPAGFAEACRALGQRSGTIDLVGVDWAGDGELAAAAPAASWSLWMGPGTEQPGLWLACTPAAGLAEAAHSDGEVMVPLHWADPRTRDRYAAAQLARIRTTTAALAGTDAAAALPPGREAPAAAGGGERVRRIIGGLRYDTGTAETVLRFGRRRAAAGIAWEDTGLYRTPAGGWFIAGRGGPLSRWAEPTDDGGWTDGEGLAPLTPDEARELLESLGSEEAVDVLEARFADRIADAAEGDPPRMDPILAAGPVQDLTGEPRVIDPAVVAGALQQWRQSAAADLDAARDAAAVRDAAYAQGRIDGYAHAALLLGMGFADPAPAAGGTPRPPAAAARPAASRSGRPAPRQHKHR